MKEKKPMIILDQTSEDNVSYMQSDLISCQANVS